VVEIDPTLKSWYSKVDEWERQGFEVYVYESPDSFENAAINSLRLKGHIQKYEVFFHE